MKNDCIIRLERTEERRETENLIREAFWNVYRPGCLEHYVINQLRNDEAFVPELNFVMEKDGKLIGQNMFMRAVIKADDGSDLPIMTMGPICIANEFKRQGYGKILLDYLRCDNCGKSVFPETAEFGEKGCRFTNRLADALADGTFQFSYKKVCQHYGVPASTASVGEIMRRRIQYRECMLPPVRTPRIISIVEVVFYGEIYPASMNSTAYFSV